MAEATVYDPDPDSEGSRIEAQAAKIIADAVNHPQHYGGDTTYETIKVIEAWGLGFALGNAVKYISRADLKDDALEDLRKAAWYVQREIERRTSAGPSLLVRTFGSGPDLTPEEADDLREKFSDAVRSGRTRVVAIERCACYCSNCKTQGCSCECFVHGPQTTGGKP